MAAEAQVQRRVFFALWPEAAAQSQLDEYGAVAHRFFGGRRMRRETLHLTLAFVGHIPSQRLAELEGIAGSIRAPSFELTLDRLECVPRKKIVWAGASGMPDALRDLAAGLNARLKAADFHTEERPFAAHVTLLRNARCDGERPETPRMVWRVGEFVLAESELKPAGASYRILRRFGLIPATAPAVRPPA